MNFHTDTIIALATASGPGAIAVIRLSGPDSISIVDRVFKGKKLAEQPSHTLHFGNIYDEETLLDEVVVSLFKAPHSYTKEEVVEISCHGSEWVISQLLQLFLKQGARPATAGEFTKRAFLNGRFDLAQAEAVADLIAADSAAAHELAIKQMRGGFSEQIKVLRKELIHFASLVELELDFGEEDVAFADRDQLETLVGKLLSVITALRQSFALGNVLKTGVPVIIIGKPNAGKSTLLNALLNEDRAIVSSIAGTTRDLIEDEIVLGGIRFRFIDTAGLRETEDQIEQEGVTRTLKRVNEASVIIYLFDLTRTTPAELEEELTAFRNFNGHLLMVGNKLDEINEEELASWKTGQEILFISASKMEGLTELKEKLIETVNSGPKTESGLLVTNARHYHELSLTEGALQQVIQGLQNGLTGDWVAADIKVALYHLGLLTGEITTNDLLENIFSKFCIGK